MWSAEAVVARARVAIRDGMLRCIVEWAPRWIQKVGVYEKVVLASEGRFNVYYYYFLHRYARRRAGPSTARYKGNRTV